MSFLRAGGVVLPFEADAPVLEGAQAMVGDGDAVGVAGQVLQHRRPAERRLDVNHPVMAAA